jgi:hypothetical protein
LQRFLGPNTGAKYIYSDNSGEIKLACKELEFLQDTSTPHRSETNGIAERAVRRVNNGTSSSIVQSGLNDDWWKEAMECYSFLRNVVDLLQGGKTAYHRKFGMDYPGPTYLFGAWITYLPSSAKDKMKCHAMGQRTLHGIFMGYHQQA